MFFLIGFLLCLTPRCFTPHGYLITLSALASTFGGIVRPICFAAFKLIDEFELRGLLDRYIGGLYSFQDLVHVRPRRACRVRPGHFRRTSNHRSQQILSACISPAADF